MGNSKSYPVESPEVIKARNEEQTLKLKQKAEAEQLQKDALAEINKNLPIGGLKQIQEAMRMLPNHPFTSNALNTVLSEANNNNTLIINRKKETLKYLLCDKKVLLPDSYFQNILCRDHNKTGRAFLAYIIEIIPKETFKKHIDSDMAVYSRDQKTPWVDYCVRDVVAAAAIATDRLDLLNYIPNFNFNNLKGTKSKEMRYFLICNGASTGELTMEQLIEIYDAYGEIVDERLIPYVEKKEAEKALIGRLDRDTLSVVSSYLYEEEGAPVKNQYVPAIDVI